MRRAVPAPHSPMKTTKLDKDMVAHYLRHSGIPRVMDVMRLMKRNGGKFPKGMGETVRKARSVRPKK